MSTLLLPLSYGSWEACCKASVHHPLWSFSSLLKRECGSSAPMHAVWWRVKLWRRLFSSVLRCCVSVTLLPCKSEYLPRWRMIYNGSRFALEISYIMLQCLCCYATSSVHRSHRDSPLPVFNQTDLKFHERDSFACHWLCYLTSGILFPAGIKALMGTSWWPGVCAVLERGASR